MDDVVNYEVRGDLFGLAIAFLVYCDGGTLLTLDSFSSTKGFGDFVLFNRRCTIRNGCRMPSRMATFCHFMMRKVDSPG